MFNLYLSNFSKIRFICALFGIAFSNFIYGNEDINILKEKAEKGDAVDQFRLGDYYFNSDPLIGVDEWWQNQVEAVRWYRLAAEQGEAMAQANLGFCYYDGRGVGKNYAEAVKWYSKAADQGNASAQTNLGVCYENGQGVQKHEVEAVRLYRLAVEQGDANAQVNLGACYYYGKGVEKNDAEAVKWYRRAVDQGNARAQANLGLCYASGRGVQKDEVEAVRLYRLAAEQGEAYYFLGQSYYHGQGVQKDEVEAVKWYRRAAAKRLAIAQIALGACYANGRGVEKNDAEAVKWFRRAADQGNASAQTNLGLCYVEGQGVQKDEVEAVKWFRMAAEQGNANAQANLGLCYAEGQGVQKDEVEAVKWFRMAAEQGDANAQANLGVCYVSGRGVQKNEVEAVKWFRKAAEKELTDAQLRLGHCYKEGKGVKKDLNQAVAWYEKAIKGGSQGAVAELAWLLSNPRKDDDKFKPDYKRAALLLEQLADKTESHYCKLGYIYGKIKNLDKMIEAYEKAVNLGSATAMSNMAVCYRKGDGVVKNYAESLSYEYLAQANGKPNKEAISFLENYLAPASIQAAQKKAQLLHAQIKENKNNPKSDTVSKAPKGDTPSRPSGSGSGVIISKTGIVATAFHVVEGATIIKIKTSDATYKGEVLASDKSNDIAILQIEGGDPSFSAVPIASSGAVKLGQSVFTLGFPNIEVQGFNLKMTKGDISSTSGIRDDPRLFQISVPVQSGNSGGPLFDENGNVVGIVVAKLNEAFMAKHTGDLPQNVNYAVKSAYLTPLVEEFSEQLPNRNHTKEEEKTEDLVSKVKDACVMILVE